MLLIKPSILIEAQSNLITPFVYSTLPTSLGFLAGYLREYNKIVPTIIDEHLFPLNRRKLEELLKTDSPPKIVGMTVVTINSYGAFQLAKLIKEIDKDYIIVLGGIHPTVLPEECLDNIGVDIVVRGEGETVLSELARCVVEDKDYSELRGISYKKGGKVIHNPNGELTNIDSVPPFPYDLFDSIYEQYRDFGTVISARGCPFDCIFCSQRAITGRRYRSMPIERVLDDVELLITKYAQKKIWFMDDNFLVDKTRAMTLLEGMIERGFHKKAGFCAEMRGESASYEILRKMKEANFYIASFGMETGSQRLLDLLNKKEKVEDNVRAIKMAHEVGLTTSATLIFGIPTETHKERLETARLVRSIPLDDARFNVAIPYPGTRLFEMAKQENRLVVKPHWSNFNVQFYVFGDDIPYVPVGTNKHQLIFDTFIANLAFYLRPKTLINFFTAPIAGGMIMTFPKRWYLSPRQLFRFIHLGMYIMMRFLKILLRLLFVVRKE